MVAPKRDMSRDGETESERERNHRDIITRANYANAAMATSRLLLGM
jgi:hypothetical protein